MDIFLPIAHMDVNFWLILLFGGGVGFLSGLLGVGGGFLITPLLIFIGVPPIVSVATGTVAIAGSSASSGYAHWRLGNVDIRMAGLVLFGGYVGGILGVQLANILESGGDFGTIVTFMYLALLGFIGPMMLIESVRALRTASRKSQISSSAVTTGPSFAEKLPWQMNFPAAGLRMSVLLPIVVGFVIAVITSLMGVGGVIMIPAMIYILKMPTKVAIGTSLFQLLFKNAEISLLQSGLNHAIDPYLAIILVVSSSLGSLGGVKVGALLPGNKLRLILALVVIAVGLKLFIGIIVKPSDLYTLVLPR